MKEGVHACTPLNYYRMYRYIFVLSAFGRRCFFIFMREKIVNICKLPYVGLKKK